MAHFGDRKYGKPCHEKHKIMKRRNSFIQSIKNSSLVFTIAILMACQAETSAQTDAATTAAKSSEVATETVSETNAQAEQTTEVTPAVKPAISAPAQSTLTDAQYSLVKEPITVSTGDKIEVAELFWFGCGHCYALEPKIKQWKANKPANAEFVKVPALFSRRWEFHGQAYYTMEALGAPEAAYEQFFRRIHVDRRGVNSLDQLVDFLGAYDKTKEQVESTFNSFAVDTKMRNAKKITNASGATGVPAIIVDGKYLTSQSQAGGNDQLFDVVNQLVDKAAAER